MSAAVVRTLGNAPLTGTLPQNTPDAIVADAVKATLAPTHGIIVFSEGKFWTWSDAARCWTILPHDFLVTLIARLGPFGIGKARSVIAMLAAQRSQPAFFSSPTCGIPCENGFVRIDENGPVLHEHSPEHRNRHCLRGRYRNGTRGKLLHTLLTGCFQDDPEAASKVSALQQLFGCVALGIATRLKQPKAFVFLGITANNGKSQTLKMLQAMVPTQNLTNISLDQLASDQYRYVPMLVGSILNVNDDMPSKAQLTSGIFKMLITGETFVGRRVMAQETVVHPTAQLAFAGNTLPDLGHMDEGIKRRLAVIEFLRRIPDAEMIADIGRRIASEESDAVLSWAIAGAASLLSNGGAFTLPVSSDRLVGEWRDISDPISAFVLADLRKDPTSRLARDEAWKAWRDYARDANVGRDISMNGFWARLQGTLGKSVSDGVRRGIPGWRVRAMFEGEAETPRPPEGEEHPKE